jgi:hypothetical protein
MICCVFALRFFLTNLPRKPSMLMAGSILETKPLAMYPTCESLALHNRITTTRIFIITHGVTRPKVQDHRPLQGAHHWSRWRKHRSSAYRGWSQEGSWCSQVSTSKCRFAFTQHAALSALNPKPLFFFSRPQHQAATWSWSATRGSSTLRSSRSRPLEPPEKDQVWC